MFYWIARISGQCLVDVKYVAYFPPRTFFPYNIVTDDNTDIIHGIDMVLETYAMSEFNTFSII